MEWDLPETLRDVIPVLGRQRAFEVAAIVNEQFAPPSHAGTRVRGRRGRRGSLYIPAALLPGKSQRIVELLGPHDAARMVAAFPGEMLWFPGVDVRVRRRRDEAIARMTAAGWSRKVVAWSFGLNERTVANISRVRKNPSV